MEAAGGAGGASGGGGESQPPKTLVDWALEILGTADPDEKARLGDLAATEWLRGAIPLPYDPSRPARPPPDRPARSAAVRLLPPSRAPKLGKGGSAQSRLALLHSLAHTESWAVDLSWDIVARFGAPLRMPREFFDDFARVAQDEGRHFAVLSARLRELGSHYGALPAHDGLWDSATRTSHSLLARLAVEHCVHEVSILLMHTINWISISLPNRLTDDSTEVRDDCRIRVASHCKYGFITIMNAVLGYLYYFSVVRAKNLKAECLP
jgi:hypothetical protein